MLHHRFPSWLRFGTVAACVSAPIVLTATPTVAESLAPILQRPADASVLKRLPASRDLMTFRGENSSSAWPVFLSRNEAAQITTLQLGLLNTVSALPEGSILKVAVNGRPLSSLPIRSPERVTPIAIKIPTGILVPGFNAVQVDVTMTHRVDCSVKATFELWTSLDPALTGFILPRQMPTTSKTLDDLAGEPFSAEGTTRIHVRLPADPDPILLGRAGDLVGALAARAHLLRPVVDVGPEPGEGAGFDVVLDGSGMVADRRIGQEAGLTLQRDPASNRVTVEANATDETTFSATIEMLRRSSDRPAEGSEQGLQALATQSAGVAVDDRSISFDDLGVHSVTFAGRHLTRSLGVTLPRDFYPSNYGTARLYIDGSRAEGLLPSSALVFRVNGALVSSLPLGPGSPDRFDHGLVNLPLKFFRPGYNAVEIEGTTPTASDDQCTVSSASAQPRLTIADTSELVMPHLARMQTAPQIAAMLQNDREQDGDREIYLTHSDAAAAGVGLTLVANMATQDGAGRIRFNLDQPVASDKPGIVIGPSASLPEMLARPLRNEFKRAEAADDKAGTEPAGAPVRGKVQASTPLDAFHAAVAGGSSWLRRNGFFFSGLDDNHVILPVHDDSLLLADVTTQSDSRRIAGMELPRFSDRQDRWLVVTGASTDAMASTNATLIANNHWRDLAGEAVAYDPKDDGLKRIEPTQLSYVIPKTVALTDVQPILGGIVSSNIVLSVSLLMVLLGLLGLSTHTLLNILGNVAMNRTGVFALLLGSAIVLCGPLQARAGGTPATDPAESSEATERLVQQAQQSWFEAEWKEWKTRFVNPDGRVVDNGNNDASHSEGQGYGMLLAALAKDRQGFEQIWGWTDAHLFVRPDGLAAWRWDEKSKAVSDRNNATDGDLLMAWGLTRAAAAFKVPAYRERARTIALAIGRTMVIDTAAGPTLLPGGFGFRPETSPTDRSSTRPILCFRLSTRSPAWRRRSNGPA